MKPQLPGDEKSAMYFQDGGDTIKDSGLSRKTVLIVGAVVGLTCFLVIVGVTVGTFYLGMRTERQSVKDAWVNFKTADNGTIIKERLVVKDNEVDVRRPGVFRMVIDYETNRFVMQSDKPLRGDEAVVCYVYDFQPGMFGTKEQTEETVASGQRTQTVPARKTITFESTGVEIPLEQLSPIAREMCYGATIMTIRKTVDEGARMKRDCAWYCEIECVGGECTYLCVEVCVS